MFASIEPDDVRWSDGRKERVDVILWAAGFRPAIKHLAPLHLTSAEGGIALERVAGNVQAATVAAKNPRINLVGYGPSASSVGCVSCWEVGGSIRAAVVAEELLADAQVT